MRGTQTPRSAAARRAGNTPADAGNSRPREKSRAPIKKHPRRCGELSTYEASQYGTPETPPQMRGTRTTFRTFEVDMRNTPADAGNSFQASSSGANVKKHPRRCGELATAGNPVWAYSETPPQMRGTLIRTEETNGRTRNTPADAGNSRARSAFVLQIQKHPRRCGELRRR